MTATNRVFLGAALGAIMMLLVHPLSRPYLIGVLSGPSPDSLRRFDLEFHRPLPPESVLEAAHWSQIASQKMLSHQFSTKELKSLKMVVAEAKKRDAENAFWTQIEAVACLRMGDEDGAKAAWTAGAKCTEWNDYQSDQLRRQSQALSNWTHETQGWQLAYLYRQRSDAAAKLIDQVARTLVSKTDLESPESLTLRYATVANGALLREGSRNVAIGQIGASIVEVGAYPADLVGRHSPKRLLLGENDLFNNLNLIGRPNWAGYVQTQFGKNEAWQALSTMEMAADEARDLGLTALVLAVLPGAVFFVGLVGLAVWGFGVVCANYFSGRGFGWIFPVVCGATLSVAVYFLTSYIVAAMAAAMCGLFLAVSPVKQRSKRSNDFGPTFGFVIGCLATAAGLSLTAYLVWGSGPAVTLLPSLAVPSEYYGGSPLFIGLAVLFFSMAFLVTPFWGLAQRMPTPFVFSEGMKRFGSTLAISALALTVILGPVVIYADQRTSETLRRLLLNEPVYYHLKNAPGS